MTNLAELPRKSNPTFGQANGTPVVYRLAMRIVRHGRHERVALPESYTRKYDDVIRLGSFELRHVNDVYHGDTWIGRASLLGIDGHELNRAWYLRIAGEPWNGEFAFERVARARRAIGGAA